MSTSKPYEELQISLEQSEQDSFDPSDSELRLTIMKRKCKMRRKCLIMSIVTLSLISVITIILFTFDDFRPKTKYSHYNGIQCKDSCCIFCYGDMLEVVQSLNLYNDSKYFVDLEMLIEPEQILIAWNKTIVRENRTHDEQAVRAFISQYLNNTAGSDITACVPIDYDQSIDLPLKLKHKIYDIKLQSFASRIYHLWTFLCKRIKTSVYNQPKRHSLIPLRNPQMIVAGGRFRELYYWDSYWIIHGLLVSNMSLSAKQTVDNLIHLTADYGHMLNGNRIYYRNRSQPPLLTLMVDAIYEFENKNDSYILNNVQYLNILKHEYLWWMNKSNQQVISVRNHTLNRYFINSSSPRPESYSHDQHIVDALQNDTAARENIAYSSLRSAAESGWDFSSRWCVHRRCTNDLTNINTINVIPVDLNAYLYFVELTLAKLFNLTSNHENDSYAFSVAARKRLRAIYDVLWDKEAKKWRDFDIKHGQQLKDIRTVASYVPLWLLPYNETMGIQVLNALNESGLILNGGILTTDANSTQQWDFPNAWPPMQWIAAKAAEKYKDTNIGDYLLRNITQTYINTAYIGFNKSGFMHEKYDAREPGKHGAGGEYKPQQGFGWSNGVALSFLYDYGDMLKAPDIA